MVGRYCLNQLVAVVSYSDDATAFVVVWFFNDHGIEVLERRFLLPSGSGNVVVSQPNYYPRVFLKSLVPTEFQECRMNQVVPNRTMTAGHEQRSETTISGHGAMHRIVANPRYDRCPGAFDGESYHWKY